MEFAELHRIAVIGNLHIACQSVGIFLLAGFDGNLVILHIRHSAVSGVVCIHHRYNLQHIFILIQSQCYVIGGILQGSGKLADGRFLPIQSDFHIIIQIEFLFGRAILDRNLGIGDILQLIFLFSCLLDAVLGICHRDTAHILPFVGHLHSIPCFDIRKSNRLSVIFRRYLSLHPKQAQRGTACRHRQENIPILHRLAVGHCPCCSFPVGFRSLIFHQLIIGFYGKHRHLRTGDVLLGIEFIIRIPHHQIHSVQQLQIGHCRCGNRILIGIAQCCAGFHVIPLYGIHRLPENHADILAVCRLCAALQLIQLRRCQNTVFQAVCRCLIRPCRDVIRADYRLPFCHRCIIDILLRVCLHDGIHQLHRFAIGHVVSRLAVTLAVFLVAAHQPKLCRLIQKRLKARPRHRVDIHKGCCRIGRH